MLVHRAASLNVNKLVTFSKLILIKAWLRHAKHVSKDIRQGLFPACSCSLSTSTIRGLQNPSKSFAQDDVVTSSVYGSYPQLKYGVLDPQFLASHIVTLLECTPEQAEKLCQLVPELKEMHVGTLEEYVKFLKENGFTLDMFLKHPWILSHSMSTIRPRLHFISQIGLSFKTVPLLKVPIPRLEHVVNKWLEDVPFFQTAASEGHKDRLEYFAHHLKCPVNEMAEAAVEHSPLLTLELDRMMRITKVLLEHGVSTDDIKKDLWIYRHNESTICDRASRAHAAGVRQIKTWMLRCPEMVFVNVLKKWCHTKEVLGEHEDLVSYLAKRLDCSREYVLYLARRYPRLLSINLPKLKDVLDFLYENGFSSDQVCLHPRILSHSIATVRLRFQELQSFGYRPLHLHTLSLTSKEYKALVEKLRKEREFQH